MRSVLDALPDRVAVLDRRGRIRLVNRAWRDAVAALPDGVPPTWVGVDYLAVCRRAQGSDQEAALRVLTGLEQVLQGERDSFSLEYPCPHAAGRPGWFRVQITPLDLPEGGAVTMHHDLTATRQALLSHRQAEANYRTILDSVEAAIFVHDPADGRILEVNRRASELYGYSPEELLTLRTADLSAGDAGFSQEAVWEKMEQGLAEGFTRFEWLARARDGHEFWVEVVLRRVELHGRPRLLAMVRDLTWRKDSEDRLELAAKVFANSSEGITITDPQGTIQMVNPAFTEITGYSAAEALGQNPRILKSDRHNEAFYRHLWRSLVTTGQWQGEIWNRRKSGEAYPEWLTISAIRDAAGRTTHYVALFHDISESKQSEERMWRQAHHDALTGLPNRLLFQDRLAMALGRARRRRQQVAVVFLDLDGFKEINDTLGHAAGDLVLQEAAARLTGALREEDTVSRLGGDEFLMILPEVAGPAEARQAGRRILAALAPPFILAGREITVGASLGVALFPRHAGDLDTLIRCADQAMYQAKRAGRGQGRLFGESEGEGDRSPAEGAQSSAASRLSGVKL
ncbi:MAG: diguanylate cyclase [Deltaproteobacteria bacterium]|nr:diguanylate cyclase [Deltaproteobacteria bacterium]